jgi:hypothetical protein
MYVKKGLFRLKIQYINPEVMENVCVQVCGQHIKIT